MLGSNVEVKATSHDSQEYCDGALLLERPMSVIGLQGSAVEVCNPVKARQETSKFREGYEHDIMNYLTRAGIDILFLYAK